MSMYSPFQALCTIFIGTGGEFGLIITPVVEGMDKEADADDWWTHVSEAAGGIEPRPTVHE